MLADEDIREINTPRAGQHVPLHIASQAEVLQGRAPSLR